MIFLPTEDNMRLPDLNKKREAILTQQSLHKPSLSLSELQRVARITYENGNYLVNYDGRTCSVKTLKEVEKLLGTY